MQLAKRLVLGFWYLVLGESIATLCRPDTWDKKTGPKLTAIEALKNVKNDFDRSVDRSVELGLSLCLQQNVYGGVGIWLRYAGRGLQKDRVIGKSGDRVIG